MFRLYFSPSGRIRRSTWWLHCVLIRSLIQTLLIWLAQFVLVAPLPDFFLLVVFAVLVFGVVGLVWSFFAMTSKRLHDGGSSGWLSLLVLIPVLGGLILLCMAGFSEGTDGPNRYGDAV